MNVPPRIATAVKQLFKPDVAGKREIEIYYECLLMFDEQWKGAKEALKERHRYAESLFAAGLLCRIQWPRLDKDGLRVWDRVVYCRHPDDY